jgi:hypothetical protein
MIHFFSGQAFPALVNKYEPDPNVRMEQLLFESEDLRQIHEEVRRFWINDESGLVAHPSSFDGLVVPPSGGISG